MSGYRFRRKGYSSAKDAFHYPDLPSVPHLTFIPAKSLIQKRCQPDNPVMECRMVDDYTLIRHYLLQVAQAHGIRLVPANALGIKNCGIIQAVTGFLDRRHSQATLHKEKSMLPDHSLMRQNMSIYLSITGDSSAHIKDVFSYDCFVKPSTVIYYGY